MNFDLEQIRLLLRSVEVNRIKEKGQKAPIFYSEFRLESLLRIHILPYFYPFKSYRHLAFYVAERPELQSIVGLEGPETPSRATLWHFRSKNSKLFRLLLARALAVVSVEALQRGIKIQFCKPCNESTEQDGIFDTFIDSWTGAKITTSTRPRIREKQTFLPLFPSEEIARNSIQKKLSLYEEIELPMHVCWSKDSGFLSLCVNQPPWSDFPEKEKDLGVILGRAGKKPYTACNIIVLDKQKINVLLSKRLIGAGKGDYTLPGGKMNDGESIRNCVIRELREEVGLEFREGYIVSDRKTNVPGFPQVRSIGVVATDWAGELKKRNPEPHAHGKWEWHSMKDLPTPLFFPSKHVLDDYLGKKIRKRPLKDDLPFSKFWR